ncbi:hypothetical protein ACFE04_022567 [Oxalis oulophora]
MDVEGTFPSAGQHDVVTTSNGGVGQYRLSAGAGENGKSWELLCGLSGVSNLPWLVGGNFNEILNQSEKSGGLRRLEGKINNFRQGIHDCNLQEVTASGPFFTWKKNRSHGMFLEKLNRVVANGLRSWCRIEYKNIVGAVKVKQQVVSSLLARKDLGVCSADILRVEAEINELLSSFLRAPANNRGSCIWKGFIDAHEVLLRSGSWRVCDGDKISILDDKWVLGQVGRDFCVNPVSIAIPEKVCDLMS